MSVANDSVMDPYKNATYRDYWHLSQKTNNVVSSKVSSKIYKIYKFSLPVDIYYNEEISFLKVS